MKWLRENGYTVHHADGRYVKEIVIDSLPGLVLRILGEQRYFNLEARYLMNGLRASSNLAVLVHQRPLAPAPSFTAARRARRDVMLSPHQTLRQRYRWKSKIRTKGASVNWPLCFMGSGGKAGSKGRNVLAGREG